MGLQSLTNCITPVHWLANVLPKGFLSKRHRGLVFRAIPSTSRGVHPWNPRRCESSKVQISHIRRLRAEIVHGDGLRMPTAVLKEPCGGTDHLEGSRVCARTALRIGADASTSACAPSRLCSCALCNNYYYHVHCYQYDMYACTHIYIYIYIYI